MKFYCTQLHCVFVIGLKTLRIVQIKQRICKNSGDGLLKAFRITFVISALLKQLKRFSGNSVRPGKYKDQDVNDRRLMDHHNGGGCPPGRKGGGGSLQKALFAEKRR